MMPYVYVHLHIIYILCMLFMYTIYMGVFDYGSSDHWGHRDFKLNTPSQINKFMCKMIALQCPTSWLGTLAPMMSHVCWYP